MKQTFKRIVKALSTSTSNNYSGGAEKKSGDTETGRTKEEKSPFDRVIDKTIPYLDWGKEQASAWLSQFGESHLLVRKQCEEIETEGQISVALSNSLIKSAVSDKDLEKVLYCMHLKYGMAWPFGHLATASIYTRGVGWPTLKRCYEGIKHDYHWSILLNIAIPFERYEDAIKSHHVLGEYGNDELYKRLIEGNTKHLIPSVYDDICANLLWPDKGPSIPRLEAMFTVIFESKRWELCERISDWLRSGAFAKTVDSAESLFRFLNLVISNSAVIPLRDRGSEQSLLEGVYDWIDNNRKSTDLIVMSLGAIEANYVDAHGLGRAIHNRRHKHDGDEQIFRDVANDLAFYLINVGGKILDGGYEQDYRDNANYFAVQKIYREETADLSGRLAKKDVKPVLEFLGSLDEETYYSRRKFDMIMKSHV